MAGIFYTDVASANKQAESWFCRNEVGGEGGQRGKKRRAGDERKEEVM